MLCHEGHVLIKYNTEDKVLHLIIQRNLGLLAFYQNKHDISFV